MYADIIIDITHEKLDRVFQYEIPELLDGKLDIGMEVVVPFGRGNRETHGYIVGFSKDTQYEKEKMKQILRVEETAIAIESKLVKLAAWMKENYGGTMIQSLKTVLPIKRMETEKQKRFLRRVISMEEGRKRLEFYLEKNQKARARLMAALLEDERLEYTLVMQKLHITTSVIQALEKQGVLEIESERVFRTPDMIQVQNEKKLHFTEEQENAIHTFYFDYENGKRKTYLIHGVTGSGKTEVYMEMIDLVVRQGRQAIVLIPEISLTYQTVMRFCRKFGDRVSIMNSKMSAGERYDQMQRAKMGKVDIVIGPRSALFTPFSNLGLIIIDEEHEGTYKSEQVPRYHARETAIERARLEGASVVLGSATPSMESYYRSLKGEYQLLEMRKRAGVHPLPEVHVADMRKELQEGNRSIFSRCLREKMEDRLKKGQQTMLFINRRGYAGFISCRSCGHVVKCPHCEVSLSIHNNGKMICHYCGHEEPVVRTCPECGSKHVGGFKAGTQQIEEWVKREFPEARVLRMDMDTTRQKDGYEKILAAFSNEEADILIGTQMIVKGHDFPGVTLVGVLAADMSLNSGGYRSGERTFQLLTQAAGRAGRGKEKGEVVIQSYQPENYSIQTAAAQDYDEFYRQEIRFRRMMGYPPAEHMLAILAMGEDEQHLDTAMEYLKQYALRAGKQNVEVIGPAKPSVSKIKDVHRRILYLKCSKYDMLIRIKDFLERYIEINEGFHSIRIQFDFDPMNLL